MHSSSHSEERRGPSGHSERLRGEDERRHSSRKISVPASPSSSSHNGLGDPLLRRDSSLASLASRDREERSRSKQHSIPEGEVSHYGDSREDRHDRHHRRHHSRSPEEEPSPSHSSSHRRRRGSAEGPGTPSSSRSLHREGSSASAMSSSSSFMSYPDSALASVDSVSMRSGASALMSTDSTVISGRKGSTSRTPKSGEGSPSRSIAGAAQGPKVGEESIDKGTDCLYIARDKSLIVAKCTKVDRTIDPPGFEIYILNRDAYVETERHRLLTINEAVVYRERQRREEEEEKLRVASKLTRRRERSQLVEEESSVKEAASLQAYESKTRRRSLQRGSVQESFDRAGSRGSNSGAGSGTRMTSQEPEERRHRRHQHSTISGGEPSRDHDRERAHREREHREHRERHHRSPEVRGGDGGSSRHAESPTRRHREHGESTSSSHHLRDREGERSRRDPASSARRETERQHSPLRSR